MLAVILILFYTYSGWIFIYHEDNMIDTSRVKLYSTVGV